MLRPFLSSVSSLLLFASALWYVRCQSPTPASTPQADTLTYLNHAPDVAYVGSAACQPCHADVYEAFGHTGKGRGFAPARPSTVAATFARTAVYDSLRDLHYRTFWRDSTLVVAEYRLRGRDTAHYREEVADYVIGSGNQTQSFLREEQGYFYQMPVTWYREKDLWDLSPGYEEGNNTRFERPVGDGCLFCHNTYVDFVAHSTNRFRRVSIGVGCEKCHGPGALHVAKWQAGADTAAEDRTIVNPAGLALSLQLDVCQQCHLEGVAVARDGRDPTDFRPGARLNDYVDVFVPATPGSDEYGFASHAERLRLSACFQQSAGQLNCSSCHDAHRQLPSSETVYTARCQSCHQPQGEALCAEGHGAGSSCVSCHMPRSGTTDIPHVSTADHYIRIPDRQPKAPATPPTVLTRLTDAPATATNRAAAYLKYFETIEPDPIWLRQVDPHQLSFAGRLKWTYLRRTRPDFSLDTLPPTAMTEPYAAFYLGELRHRSGLPALPWYERAVALAPDNRDLLFYLAQRYREAGQTERARQTYRDLLVRQPRHARALHNLGYLEIESGRLEEAARLMAEALVADPDYRLARENQVLVLFRLGQSEEANRLLDALVADFPDEARYRQLQQQLGGT